MEEANKIIERIDALTGEGSNQRDALLRYAAKSLPETLRLRALAKAQDFYYSNRAANPTSTKAELVYAGFILALKAYHYADIRSMSRKDTDKHIATIQEVHDGRRRASIKRRFPNKKKEVEQYLDDILQSRREGHSLQDIVTWLMEAHKLNVTKEYLRRIVNANSKN